MSLITISNISDNTTIDASDVNNPLNTIVNDYNGNITSANLANNAITSAKITDGNITYTKISNPYKYGSYLSAVQGVGTGWVKVNANTEEFDPNSNYDNTTNYRYTAPVAGYYQFNAAVGSSSNASFPTIAGLYKNGVLLKRGNQAFGNGTQFDASVSSLILLAAGDYIELWVYNGAGANLFSGQDTTYINGFLVP